MVTTMEDKWVDYVPPWEITIERQFPSKVSNHHTNHTPHHYDDDRHECKRTHTEKVKPITELLEKHGPPKPTNITRIRGRRHAPRRRILLQRTMGTRSLRRRNDHRLLHRGASASGMHLLQQPQMLERMAVAQTSRHLPRLQIPPRKTSRHLHHHQPPRSHRLHPQGRAPPLPLSPNHPQPPMDRPHHLLHPSSRRTPHRHQPPNQLRHPTHRPPGGS